MLQNPDGELDVNGRTVVVRLTQWDLLALNVGFMPRLGTLWGGLLLVALGAGLGLVLSDDLPELARTGLIMLAAVAFVAALASMAGFLFSVGIISTAPVSDPSLLDHSYTLQPDGLRTRAGDLDAFVEWRHVRNVRRTPRFILIDVAPGLYHALPRRSFGSSREYQAFWSALTASRAALSVR
jgi:hypothetical protein